MIRSVWGTCATCGHPRVVAGSHYCGICNADAERRDVRRLVMLYMVPCTPWVPSDGPERRLPPPPKNSRPLTVEDVGHEHPKCWICGEGHYRMDCPSERLVGRFRMKKTLGPSDNGPIMLNPYSAAIADEFRRWLVGQGWLVE